MNINVYELYNWRCLWMAVHLLRVAYLKSARWAWMCEGELALHPLHGDSFYSPYELAKRNSTARCENAVYSTLKTLRRNVLQPMDFVSIKNPCFPLNMIFWIQAHNSVSHYLTLLRYKILRINPVTFYHNHSISIHFNDNMHTCFVPTTCWLATSRCWENKNSFAFK